MDLARCAHAQGDEQGYLNVRVPQKIRAAGYKLRNAYRRHSGVGIKMFIWIFSTLLAGVAALVAVQTIFYPYFWDDLMYYLKVRKVGMATMARMKRGILTFVDRFSDQARRTPGKPFLVFENDVYTYKDVELRSNKFANLFRSQAGIRAGDVVALWMRNEAEFVCVWFGLSKLRCEVAFINSNIKSKSLLHCIKSCGASGLVLGSGMVLFKDLNCSIIFSVR